MLFLLVNTADNRDIVASCWSVADTLTVCFLFDVLFIPNCFSVEAY